jgi:hypothetical protein
MIWELMITDAKLEIKENQIIVEVFNLKNRDLKI